MMAAFFMKYVLWCSMFLTGYCSDVTIVVLSQRNKYHVTRAAAFSEHIVSQRHDYQAGGVSVYKAHERWRSLAAWTVFAIVDKLVEELPDTKWVMLCEEETRVNVSRLIAGLSRHNASQAVYVGRGLRDASRVIIHHFHDSPPGFSYPDFAAGVAFSMPLLKLMQKRIQDGGLKEINFNIDAKHELAWFLWDDGHGVALTDSGLFCTKPDHDACATRYEAALPKCGEPIREDSLFIGIKTCEKFHSERIPIIKELWTSKLGHLEYYSESADASIPTLDLGVPNTERGHCGKTYAILERAAREEHIKNRAWLLIADDDTLMNVERLRALLACYDPSDAVALGERYGYRMHDSRGYEYITGGGGMVFSMETVRMLVACDRCRCGADDQPDDMMIGMWLKQIGVPVTHSPLFHQGRVDDYAGAYLQHQTPVSFHKFWNNDPHRDFKKYLQGQLPKHDEL